MFKKTMQFDDLDGNEVTQTFYFNYNKKEIAELLEFGCIQKYAEPSRQYTPLEEQLEILSTPTDVSGLSETENNRVAYAIFQDLILDAYGIKEADNVTFTKNESLREAWSNHVAYVEMIFEFLENPKLASEFIEKCLPAKVVAQAKEELVKEAGAAKLSAETLAGMVAEAAELQKDPATRIEPGPEAAREALGENPAIEKLAQSVADDEKSFNVDALTEEDILTMPDEEFNKIDIKKLDKVQMMAAFRRKSQS